MQHVVAWWCTLLGIADPLSIQIASGIVGGSTLILRAYHDRVFERFWRRELDIEDPEVIAAMLNEVDANVSGFRSYLAGEGRREHEDICKAAEAVGVFGVPSFLIDGELFWGREHLSDIREKLVPRRE
jgi:2-hydroxychromene-2-carboxylate isomerase